MGALPPKAGRAGSDIAVVGMACRFPHARDLGQLWRLVREGEVAFDEIGDSRWKHSSFRHPNDARAVDKTYVTKGGFVEGVDEFAALHYGLAPRRVQVTDPQHRLLVETVRQALQDAGYEKKALARAETGVFVGASVSEYKDLMTARLRAVSMADGTFGDTLSAQEAEVLRSAVADLVPTRAFTIAGSLLNMMAATVSQVFDLGGPSFTLDAACSSALVAIHEATVHLRAGQCDVALAGGVYLNLTPDNLVGFSRIGAISPSSACRPFDARADGFVMGEGVGVVVLKRYEDAVAAGDRIYAVIKGSGCNNDGRGEGPMTPRPEGQMAAMARAHREVDWPIESIGFVETHGTATVVGDVVEVGALKSFWNQKAGHALTDPQIATSRPSRPTSVTTSMSAARSRRLHQDRAGAAPQDHRAAAVGRAGEPEARARALAVQAVERGRAFRRPHRAPAPRGGVELWLRRHERARAARRGPGGRRVCARRVAAVLRVCRDARAARAAWP